MQRRTGVKVVKHYAARLCDIDLSSDVVSEGQASNG